MLTWIDLQPEYQGSDGLHIELPGLSDEAALSLDAFGIKPFLRLFQPEWHQSDSTCPSQQFYAKTSQAHRPHTANPLR